MSEEQRNTNLLAGLLIAGATATGALFLLGGKKEMSPEEEYAQALREIERLPHPLSPSYQAAWHQAMSRFSAAKARLEVKKSHEEGIIGDPHVDEAYIKMQSLKYEDDPRAFAEAMNRFGELVLQESRRNVAKNSSESSK